MKSFHVIKKQLKVFEQNLLKFDSFLESPAFIKMFKYVLEHPEVIGNTYFTAYGIKVRWLLEEENDEAFTDEEL